MNKDLENNATFSHYRIVRKIGAGARGEICLVQDTKLDRIEKREHKGKAGSKQFLKAANP